MPRAAMILAAIALGACGTTGSVGSLPDDADATQATPANIASLSEVIQRKPAFAEGWNKRATALYLSGEYRRSLADCAEVIKRNPRHFGALSGAGLNHLELEEQRQALGWFRRALEVNPNMGAIEAEVRRLEELLRGRST